MTKTYKYHIIETGKLAFPVIIGQLGHIMFGIVDSVMVGKVGVEPLAAASLVNSIVFLIIVIGIGVTLSITPLVSIARGKGKQQECGMILNNGLISFSFCAIILFIVTFFIADCIPFLNQPNEVVNKAIPYTKILSISIIPLLIFQVYRQFIEGLSFTRPAMYITIIANLVNVIGNWIFIYGNIGMPAYGLNGAGYSTLVTRIFMVVTICFFVYNSKKIKIYRVPFVVKSINKKIIGKLLNIGIPSGAQHFFETGAFSLTGIMVGWIGSKELAAHQISITMAAISFMIVLGISSAATIRVSHYFGEKNIKDLRRAGIGPLIISIVIMGCCGIGFILFRNFLPGLFIKDISVISIVSSLLIIVAFFQISDGVQVIGLGILRGITDVKVPMVISFVAYWVIGLPVSYYVGFVMKKGITGVWTGLVCGLTIAAVFFIWRFMKKVTLLEN